MIKIKKEDFEKILALQGAKEKIYTVEEQITEVITRLRSTGFTQTTAQTLINSEQSIFISELRERSSIT